MRPNSLFGTVSIDAMTIPIPPLAMVPNPKQQDFHLLVDGIHDYGIFMLDPQGRVLTWNTGAQKLKGYTEDEVLGRHFSMFYPPDAVEAGKPQLAIETARSTGRFQDEGFRVRKDGTRFWAQVVITALYDADGTIRGFGEVTRDLTERRFAESRYQLLVESVRDYAIIMLDPSGVVVTWNVGAEAIKGYRASDIIGTHFSKFYTQPDIDKGYPQFELDRAAAVGRYEDEGWRLRKDGSRFWANVVITALRADDGTLVGYCKVTRDLSERRKAENQLRDSEERFRLMVDRVKDYAIIMLDPTGHVISWNAGAERIKGWTAAEIIGQSFERFYPPEDVKAGKTAHELKTAIETGTFEDFGWRVRKDGSQFWANVVITALRDDAGTLRGFSKVTRDLTERKKAEEAHRAVDELQAANRSKDEFLAILGHELRNPLAPIVTALDLIRLRNNGQLPREHQIIERQVNHMLRLVDDLLDISRISRGKVELKTSRLEVAGVIAKALEVASPLLEQRRHRCQVNTPHGLQVLGDEARLTQVFSNLLTNAARYTPEGGDIEVDAALENNQVVIRVKDNGKGIAPEVLSQVFEMFVQGGRSIDRREGGLGLGLAIVRNLVAMHGGQVSAASEGVNCGSEFTVRLPTIEQELPAGLAGTAPPADEVQREHGRVLIVDDNHDAIELLAELVRSRGYEVQTAHDGPSGLAALDRFVPTVIVLDIGLPVMDGYELARQIRARPEHQTTPLIALSGYGLDKDRFLTTEAGFDQHLVKPIDVSRLFTALKARR